MKFSPQRLLFPALVLLTSTDVNAQRVGGGMDTTASWFGGTDEDYYGGSIALLDDLDGDGIADIGIGAPQKYSPFHAGYIHIRSTQTGAVLASSSGINYDYFGTSIAGVGDLNGDGIGEYAVGVPGSGNGQVIIYSGATHSVHLVVPAPATAKSFGEQIVAMGDVNGDGVADFVVGAPKASTGALSYNGGVYMISGATGSVLYSRHETLTAKYLGDAVANVGDVNHDGVDDFAAGADCVSPYSSNTIGKVFVWSGVDGALIYLWQGGREFGGEVGAAGDANSDGYADIAVGSPMEEVNTYQEGVIRMYSGASGNLLWDWHSGEVLEQAGMSLDGLGDFNDDGFEDLLVGAPMGNTAYLLSGLDGSKLHIFHHEIDMSRLGADVLGAGDLDSDGELDVFISATNSYVNHEKVGGVYRYSWSPYLATSAPSISASAGGVVSLDVDFPSGTANGNYSLGNIAHEYVLLASASGMGPSNLYGWQVPLTQDSLYNQTLAGSYPSQVSAGRGPLSLDGDATITLTFAPGTMTSMVGSTFYLCVTHYEYSSPWPTTVHGPSVMQSLTVVP